MLNLTDNTNRPRSWHTGQSLDADLDIRAWQIGQIETAIAELDAGKGISHEEIRKELLTWGEGDMSRPRT